MRSLLCFQLPASQESLPRQLVVRRFWKCPFWGGQTVTLLGPSWPWQVIFRCVIASFFIFSLLASMHALQLVQVSWRRHRWWMKNMVSLPRL